MSEILANKQIHSNEINQPELSLGELGLVDTSKIVRAEVLNSTNKSMAEIGRILYPEKAGDHGFIGNLLKGMADTASEGFAGSGGSNKGGSLFKSVAQQFSTEMKLQSSINEIALSRTWISKIPLLGGFLKDKISNNKKKINAESGVQITLDHIDQTANAYLDEARKGANPVKPELIAQAEARIAQIKEEVVAKYANYASFVKSGGKPEDYRSNLETKINKQSSSLNIGMATGVGAGVLGAAIGSVGIFGSRIAGQVTRFNMSKGENQAKLTDAERAKSVEIFSREVVEQFLTIDKQLGGITEMNSQQYAELDSLITQLIPQGLSAQAEIVLAKIKQHLRRIGLNHDNANPKYTEISGFITNIGRSFNSNLGQEAQQRFEEFGINNAKRDYLAATFGTVGTLVGLGAYNYNASGNLTDISHFGKTWDTSLVNRNFILGNPGDAAEVSSAAVVEQSTKKPFEPINVDNTDARVVGKSKFNIFENSRRDLKDEFQLRFDNTDNTKAINTINGIVDKINSGNALTPQEAQDILNSEVLKPNSETVNFLQKLIDKNITAQRLSVWTETTSGTSGSDALYYEETVASSPSAAPAPVVPRVQQVDGVSVVPDTKTNLPATNYRALEGISSYTDNSAVKAELDTLVNDFEQAVQATNTDPKIRVLSPDEANKLLDQLKAVELKQPRLSADSQIKALKEVLSQAKNTPAGQELRVSIDDNTGQYTYKFENTTASIKPVPQAPAESTIPPTRTAPPPSNSQQLPSSEPPTTTKPDVFSTENKDMPGFIKSQIKSLTGNNDGLTRTDLLSVRDLINQKNEGLQELLKIDNPAVLSENPGGISATTLEEFKAKVTEQIKINQKYADLILQADKNGFEYGTGQGEVLIQVKDGAPTIAPKPTVPDQVLPEPVEPANPGTPQNPNNGGNNDIPARPNDTVTPKPLPANPEAEVAPQPANPFRAKPTPDFEIQGKPMIKFYERFANQPQINAGYKNWVSVNPSATAEEKLFEFYKIRHQFDHKWEYPPSDKLLTEMVKKEFKDHVDFLVSKRNDFAVQLPGGKVQTFEEFAKLNVGKTDQELTMSFFTQDGVIPSDPATTAANINEFGESFQAIEEKAMNPVEVDRGGLYDSSAEDAAPRFQPFKADESVATRSGFTSQPDNIQPPSRPGFSSNEPSQVLPKPLDQAQIQNIPRGVLPTEPNTQTVIPSSGIKVYDTGNNQAIITPNNPNANTSLVNSGNSGNITVNGGSVVVQYPDGQQRIYPNGTVLDPKTLQPVQPLVSGNPLNPSSSVLSNPDNYTMDYNTAVSGDATPEGNIFTNDKGFSLVSKDAVSVPSLQDPTAKIVVQPNGDAYFFPGSKSLLSDKEVVFEFDVPVKDANGNQIVNRVKITIPANEDGLARPSNAYQQNGGNTSSGDPEPTSPSNTPPSNAYQQNGGNTTSGSFDATNEGLRSGAGGVEEYAKNNSPSTSPDTSAKPLVGDVKDDLDFGDTSKDRGDVASFKNAVKDRNIGGLDDAVVQKYSLKAPANIKEFNQFLNSDPAYKGSELDNLSGELEKLVDNAKLSQENQQKLFSEAWKAANSLKDEGGNLTETKATEILNNYLKNTKDLVKVDTANILATIMGVLAVAGAGVGVGALQARYAYGADPFPGSFLNPTNEKPGFRTLGDWYIPGSNTEFARRWPGAPAWLQVVSDVRLSAVKDTVIMPSVALLVGGLPAAFGMALGTVLGRYWNDQRPGAANTRFTI